MQEYLNSMYNSLDASIQAPALDTLNTEENIDLNTFVNNITPMKRKKIVNLLCERAPKRRITVPTSYSKRKAVPNSLLSRLPKRRKIIASVPLPILDNSRPRRRKPRKPCIKCSKPSTHASGLCRNCLSNLPKYNSRKRKYRASQISRRIPTLPSIVPAAPVINTSNNTSQNINNKNVISAEIRAAVAELQGKCFVSARQCNNVISLVSRRFNGCEFNAKLSKQTCIRSTVEAAICIDIAMSKKLSLSHGLFIGIDETSHADRMLFYRYF
jgi:hypothetical protein